MTETNRQYVREVLEAEAVRAERIAATTSYMRDQQLERAGMFRDLAAQLGN